MDKYHESTPPTKLKSAVMGGKKTITMSCTEGKSCKQRTPASSLIFNEPRQAGKTDKALKEALYEITRLRNIIATAKTGLRDEIYESSNKETKEALNDIYEYLQGSIK